MCPEKNETTMFFVLSPKKTSAIPLKFCTAQTSLSDMLPLDTCNMSHHKVQQQFYINMNENYQRITKN